MQLPAAAYPVPELWDANINWAAAWYWLHKRRPEGMNGERYIAESEIAVYAARVGLDADELAIAMDRLDAAYFQHQAATRPKR